MDHEISCRWIVRYFEQNLIEKNLKNFYLKMATKSEEEIRADIIDILDPLRISSHYPTLSVEELEKIRAKKANSVNVITHDNFQKIYDLQPPKNYNSNEIIMLKNRISTSNITISNLQKTIERLEEEILFKDLEIEKLKKAKEPRPNLIEAKDGFAAYIMAKEAENNDEEIKIEPIVETKNRQYQSYTPGRRLPGFPDQSLFQNNLNGELSEEEALKEALKESDRLANKILDDPFSKMDAEIASTNSTVVKETKGKMNFSHLKNRPNSVTDSILETIYQLLLDRKFDEVKNMLANDVTPEVSAWIRQLTYGSSNFKQMMVSKSQSIHKAISGEI